MRAVVIVLAAAVVVMAPVARGEFFEATGDGCFDTYRSGGWAAEGYSAGGGGTVVRIAKYNQQMGWLSFKDAVADGSRASLSSVVATYGAYGVAYLWMRSAGYYRMPAGTSGAYVVSLRCGNQGALIEDQGNGNGYGITDPFTGGSGIDPGYVGASELQAWRGCSPAPLDRFTTFGDGIYTMEDPTATGGVQGQPWITPSTRKVSAGATPFKWGPNQEVRYDTGTMKHTAGTDAATGKYLGFFPDTLDGAGRSYWALEDVLGMYNNNARAATTQSVKDAGQIMLGGTETPTLVNDSMYYHGPDPRNDIDADWLVIPIDMAFLQDMANNPEHKGMVFANNFAGLTASYANPEFYTKEMGREYAPYLMTAPEPATVALLALGGRLILRRRLA